jgi:phosphatidylglycerol---prolipoprotein diacylglyceryl transferase
MHPILISIGSFHLPTYGVLLVMAILGGIFAATRLGRRAGLSSALILDFCTWLILVALVGAKILMILTEWSYYRANPREIFSLSTFMAGGVFYGGFLAALFFTIWYVRVQKLSFWKLADVLAPAVALGQSVGRLGCFSAGCDYGKPTNARWGVVFSSTFAHEVTGVPLGQRLHPAQLYESVATLVIFGLLLWWFPRRKRDGDIFLAYLGLYAVARFFLEFLRGDEDRGFVFHHLLSTSQFIALLVLAGLGVVILWRKLYPYQGLDAGRGTSPEQRALQSSERTPSGRSGRGQTPDGELVVRAAGVSAAASAPKRVKRKMLKL